MRPSLQLFIAHLYCFCYLASFFYVALGKVKDSYKTPPDIHADTASYQLTNNFMRITATSNPFFFCVGDRALQKFCLCYPSKSIARVYHVATACQHAGAWLCELLIFAIAKNIYTKEFTSDETITQSFCKWLVIACYSMEVCCSIDMNCARNNTWNLI